MPFPSLNPELAHSTAHVNGLLSTTYKFSPSCGLSLTLPSSLLFSLSNSFEPLQLFQPNCPISSVMSSTMFSMHTIGGSHNCGQVEDRSCECLAKQIAARTSQIRRLPSDLFCDSSEKEAATHKICLRIERDIIATISVNWNVAKKVLLSMRCLIFLRH
jgi:hypothetical protein